MVDRIKIESAEQWHTERNKDVTASTAGCLLGVHDYMTPYALFAQKKGLVAPIEDSPAMERGKLLEPVALKLYQRQTKGVATEWNGTPGEIDGDYLRDPQWHLGATLDCRAIDARGPGIVQFKTVAAYTFKSKWQTEISDGHHDINCPLWIAVQAIVEAYLDKAKWAQVAAMVIDQGGGLDMHVIDVPIHQGILAKVFEKSADFHNRLVRNDPPPPDYGQDGETIAAIYRSVDHKETIDLRNNPRFAQLLENRETLKTSIKNMKTRADEIDAELEHEMAGHAAAIAQGWTVKNTLVKVAAYTKDVKAYSFRKITPKRMD